MRFNALLNDKKVINMEYTAEQYLERIENKRLNSTPLYSREEMIDFAEKYAKQLNTNSTINCTDLDTDFIEALNQLIDVHRKPTKKRF